MGDAAFGLAADGIDDATVEALDQTVGLRPVRTREAVIDFVVGADAIEGMAAGRAVMRLVLHVDGEAIGELAAIVGEDGVDGMREVGEEALQEPGGGIGVALRVNLQVDVAGGAIDGDEGVTFALLQGWQVLEVDMDEADARLLEDADSRLVGLGPLVESMAFEAAMDGAARQLAIETTAHHLGDVVERQRQPGAQFTDQHLFQGREADRQALRGCASDP